MTKSNDARSQRAIAPEVDEYIAAVPIADLRTLIRDATSTVRGIRGLKMESYLLLAQMATSRRDGTLAFSAVPRRTNAQRGPDRTGRSVRAAAAPLAAVVGRPPASAPDAQLACSPSPPRPSGGADVTSSPADNPYRVARIWRWRVRTERADEYATYLAEAGLKVLAATAVGVEQFREDQGDIVEFVTISYWESVEAMTRYTRGDPSAIHHLARDAGFLTEMPERVQVLQLTSRHWSGGKARTEGGAT